MNLQQRLVILFEEVKFCPICGDALTQHGNYFKRCMSGHGSMYFSDGDCADGVTACFQPEDEIFKEAEREAPGESAVIPS